MNWMQNKIIWNMILASGIIDETVGSLIIPGLQLITWSVTTSYDLYKWCRKKDDKSVFIIEYKSVNETEDKSEEDFVLVSSMNV
jgi:hypothetical protein